MGKQPSIKCVYPHFSRSSLVIKVETLFKHCTPYEVCLSDKSRQRHLIRLLINFNVFCVRGMLHSKWTSQKSRLSLNAYIEIIHKIVTENINNWTIIVMLVANLPVINTAFPLGLTRTTVRGYKATAVRLVRSQSTATQHCPATISPSPTAPQAAPTSTRPIVQWAPTHEATSDTCTRSPYEIQAK